MSGNGDEGLSQEFYRKLAAEADRDARMEAACRLREVPAAKAQNEPILRSLLADADQGVRMAAAVSLLMLSETDARKPILAWLQSPDSWPPQPGSQGTGAGERRAASGLCPRGRRKTGRKGERPQLLRGRNACSDSIPGVALRLTVDPT